MARPELSPVQADVLERFGDGGITLELVGGILGEIIRTPTSDDNPAAARVAAVKLFLQATTGLSVHRLGHLHAEPRERDTRETFFADEAAAQP